MDREEKSLSTFLTREKEFGCATLVLVRLCLLSSGTNEESINLSKKRIGWTVIQNLRST